MPRPGTEKFLEDPLGFAITHPILANFNHIAFTPESMPPTVAELHQKHGFVKMARHKLDAMNQGLCLARIEKSTSKLNKDYAGYRVNLVRYESGAPIPAGSFTAWYLPWNEAGGQVDMKIPTDQVKDNLGRDATPNYFFTASLTGCSVFIRGSLRSSPEIFHSGSGEKCWQGNSANHWRDLYKVHRPKSTRYSEVNYRDYLGGPINYDEYDGDNDTQSAIAIRHYIDSVLRPEIHHGGVISGDNIQLKSVTGVGSVFGIRNQSAFNWSFYLQQNVEFSYECSTFDTKNSRSLCRTLHVRRIWPAGGPTFVNMNPKGFDVEKNRTRMR